MLRISWRSVAICSLLAIAACCCCFLARAQQTLGSLNGTVLDPSGAAVSGATVTVNDAAINVTATTTTQKTGFFQIFNLPIGTYTVTVTQQGFEKEQLPGISVHEAQATTIDVSLKVGQTTESVEVVANPLLNATDATNGYTMDSQQIEATPLATGSFTQLALLSPGTNAELLSGLNTNSGLGNQNIQANGQRATSNTMQVNGVDVTNIFTGMTSSGLTSQRFNFNIGAGSTSASSSAGAGPVAGASLEGASPYGSTGNSLPSPPPEFIDELRVNTSMYDAQQGATAGAQIDVNTIAGTNKLHGQGYGSFADGAWNASPYFFNQQYQLAQQGIGAFPASLIYPYLNRWSLGATMGGPIKKDKVFFFLAYQHMSSTDQSTGISQMTVPSGLTNDRSTAGLDAAAESYAGGGTFTKAIDPIAMALMNAKLPNGQFLIPSAQSTNAYIYGVPNVTLVNNSIMTSDQGNAAIDWNVTGNDRLSTKYYYQSDPVTLPYDFSQTGGFPVTQNNGSQVVAIDNTIAVRPTFNWEQRLGFFRQSSYSYFTQTLTNSGGEENFGINGSTVPPASGKGPFFQPTLPGLLLKDFPSSQLDSPGVKTGPYSSFADMGFYQSRLNPSTNVIWVKGNHTIDAGGGYSFTELNIENNRNGIEQIETSNFESFLEGKIHSANVIEAIDPTTGKNNANRYYRTNEFDGYLQDKWQIKSNLSFTLGVRYDYHGGMTEKYGNFFNFDPKLFSVSGTTANENENWTVNNAGFIIAGNNKENPTPGVSDSTLTGRQWGISPRVGFAWSPSRDHGNLVVRGGGGMYYDRGEYFVYLSQPAGSGYGGPFGVTESAPLVSFVTGEGSTLRTPLVLHSLHPRTSHPAPNRPTSIKPFKIPSTCSPVRPLPAMTHNSARTAAACKTRRDTPCVPTPSTSAPTPATTLFLTPSTMRSICNGSPVRILPSTSATSVIAGVTPWFRFRSTHRKSQPLPTPFGAKPHRMVSKFSTRTPAATPTATTHPSPVSRGTRKMAATLTSAFPTSDSAPTHPITKLQASPPTMRCRPTLKSACPTTSWWAPAIRGAILLMNRATSASSSPEATPITCATPTLRPTSTAPMSSARTLASLFPTPPRLTLWPPSSSTTGTSTAPQSRRAASPIRSMSFTAPSAASSSVTFPRS